MRSAFHPPAQRNAFRRRGVHQQSRLFARGKRNVDQKWKSSSISLMKTKTTGLTLALSFFGAALCFADDPQMGTWKLNAAQSKLTPGTAKVDMVVIEPASDNVKVTGDGTDRNGKSMHNEWTGKFDGKDYPVTGNPDSDMR